MQSGVIIAGGRSTRFGDRDKAVADLAGTPMIRRVADRLAGVVDGLTVNCRADQVEAIADALEGYEHAVRFAEDPEPDLGPIGGIRTGLEAASGEYAFVVACDMPFVDPALVSHLFSVAEGADAAVPRVDDRWFQVTHTVYRASPMVEACERALDRGERKVIEPLFDLEYVVVEEPAVREHASLETFENINTQAELEAAAETLRGA